ncbi:MAG: CGA synthase-related protein [Pseudonocardiaceae bacterium]
MDSAVHNRRTVVVAAREHELDSVLARRRISAHLTEFDLIPWESWDERADPSAALICDDVDAAAKASGMGVPVVFVRSGHEVDGPGFADFGVHCRHWPGWLPDPAKRAGAPQATGVLAPVRLRQGRSPSLAVILLAVSALPRDEVVEFTGCVLRPLLDEISLPRIVVFDDHPSAIEEGLPGADLRQVCDTDVDALHADAALFVAAPTLTAVGLAQARRSALAFLPPLDRTQKDLLDLLRVVISVPVLGERGFAAVEPTVPNWSDLDPALDDLRGAQRVARQVRQLTLAPM